MTEVFLFILILLAGLTLIVVCSVITYLMEIQKTLIEILKRISGVKVLARLNPREGGFRQ